jgi:hypothetical protein
MRATCLGVSMTLAVAAAALAVPDVSPDAFKSNFGNWRQNDVGAPKVRSWFC